MRTTTRRGGAHVRRDTDDSYDTPVVDTRDRFGGLDLPAAFAGTMAAVGMLALLGVIASAWSTVYDETFSRDEVISPTGLVVGLVILVGSCLFGGWVTGRAARYNGTGNGFLTGVLLLAFAAGVGWLIGSMSDGTSFAMPGWITVDSTSNAAIMTAAIAAGVALLSCTLGGAMGSFWHRRVDRSLVVETENAAFAPYPEDERLVTPPPSYDETYEEETEDRVLDLDEPPATKKRTAVRTRRSD